MRFILKGIGLLLVAAAILIGAAWFFAPRIAAYKIGSDLGTKASVERFDIGLNHINFDGITVMSPSGSRTPKALEVASGEATATTFMALTADPFVIDRLYMRDLKFHFDFPMGPSLKSGNWGRMIGYADQHTNPSDREILIKELLLENVQVSIVGQDGTIQNLKPIDRIRLTNVSSRAGVKKSQIAALVFTQIATQVLTLENLLPMIEQATQGVEKAASDATTMMKDAAQSVKKGISDLFGTGSGASQPAATPPSSTPTSKP
jgi:hypothetical protein